MLSPLNGLFGHALPGTPDAARNLTETERQAWDLRHRDDCRQAREPSDAEKRARLEQMRNVHVAADFSAGAPGVKRAGTGSLWRRLLYRLRGR
jgi:hypothetical protein